MKTTSLLFICLGNICRSPLAQGVFHHQAEQRGMLGRLEIASAGTGGWHVGNPPDPRSIEVASQHNIDISNQTCRRLSPSDFHEFDLILGMDQDNVADCIAANLQNGAADISLFTEYGGLGAIEIPDPYYGGHDGFEIAYELIKQASDGVLDRLENQPKS